VCGGGRYDRLVEDIGGPPTPAIGFALGLERLVALLAAAGHEPVDQRPQAYLLALGPVAVRVALPLAERLRDRLPALRLVVDGGEGGLRGRLRRADRSGAEVALILGDDEAASGTVTLKDLRASQGQITIPQSEVVERLAERMRDERPAAVPA
jgi:histidyl-tRNA synthetase